MILILEDNQDRVDRFEKTIRKIDNDIQFVVWRNAHKMINEVGNYLDNALFMSLDHDLDPEFENGDDPGDGYDVVKFLCTLPPACTVIVHTSNGTRADWMQGEFELNNWIYERVPPIGDDWIETHWFTVVKKLLRSRNKKLR